MQSFTYLREIQVHDTLTLAAGSFARRPEAARTYRFGSSSLPAQDPESGQGRPWDGRVAIRGHRLGPAECVVGVPGTARPGPRRSKSYLQSTGQRSLAIPTHGDVGMEEAAWRGAGLRSGLGTGLSDPVRGR